MYLCDLEKDSKELHYTDDTEMAHVLAHSLVTDEGFDAKNVAARFVMVD